MLSMDCMQFHIRVWKISGFYWYGPDEPRWFRAYGLFIQLTAFGLDTLLVLLQLIQPMTLNDLNAMLFLMPNVSAGLKQYLVASCRQQICELFETIAAMDRTVIAPAEQQTVRDSFVSLRTLRRMISALYYLTATSMFASALLSADRQLLYKYWWPFDYRQHSRIYYSLVVFQYVTTMYHAMVHSSLDTLAATFYRLLGVHLRLLGNRMQRLGGRQLAAIKIGAAKGVATSVEEDLHNCVRLYTLCLTYARNMNSIISQFTAIQFGISTVTLCGAEFQLATINPITQTALFYATFNYMICTVCQFFTPCYFGSMLIAESDQLSVKLFHCNWYRQSPRFRSAMRIFGERAKRAIRPMAGGLFVIALPLFVSILKTGYSIFTCMQQLDD